VPSLVAGLAVGALFATAGQRIQNGGDYGFEMATAASLVLMVRNDRSGQRCP
jgi:uncharacterized membrane protein (UPF0136 family)